MNFSTPDKVTSVIQTMKDAERLRAPNRALINSLFNGEPPYTQQECEDNHIEVNVNWKEGQMLLLKAREQYENGFLTPSRFFGVRLPDAPLSKRGKFETVITAEVNKVLKGSRPYLHTMREKFGSVCLHGLGAEMYADQWACVPHFVAIEDILLPTDTEITLENVTYFAVRRRETPGSLFRKTFGKDKNIDPGWNLKVVRKALDSVKDQMQNKNQWNWAENPERMMELLKQNQSFYDSDSVPTIWIWDFYYMEDESAKPCWYRCQVLDSDCANSNASDASGKMQFLYKRDKPYADTLDEVIHIQFGDGNNKPPFLYHSVRSLGMLLFDTVSMMNRLRSQFLQKLFEDMMLLFKVQDPSDRARLEKIYLGLNYGIIPDGLQFVRKEERYSPDYQMVQMGIANMKQLMGESTAAYTQELDSGTPKERTAFEVSTILSQVTKLTGSMLNLAYLQETFAYREHCRRLCLPNSPDFTAKKFQNACKERGVPEKFLNVDLWEIEPERVLGAGNSQLQIAQAQALMNVRPMLNPSAQARVLNEYIFAYTNDPKRAEALAPLDASPEVSDTVHDTEIVYGVLMQGTPVTPKQGLNPIETIETMLRLMANEVKQMQQQNGMGTPEQLQGLMACVQYVSVYIGQLAQDKEQKERVRQYQDALKEITNMMKAFMQRQRQAFIAAQKQNGGQLDPETVSKIQQDKAVTAQKLQSKQAADMQKLRTKEMTNAQKMRHKEQEFALNQQRANTQTLAEIQTQTMQGVVDAGSQPPKQPNNPTDE